MLGPDSSTSKEEKYYSELITLAPGEKIDLHAHQFHHESVLVVSGCIMARVEGMTSPLKKGEVLLVSRLSKHSLWNDQDADGLAEVLLSYVPEFAQSKEEGIDLVWVKEDRENDTED